MIMCISCIPQAGVTLVTVFWSEETEISMKAGAGMLLAPTPYTTTARHTPHRLLALSQVICQPMPHLKASKNSNADQVRKQIYEFLIKRSCRF